MKRTYFIVFAIFVFVLTVGIAANAQAVKPTCSIEKTAGDWAFQGSGKLVDGSDALNTGTFHLDKDGTSSSHLMFNIGGLLFLEFDATGKTTVADNCILTQTWDDGVTPMSKCVVLDDSNEIWCVYDKPMFFKVELKRIHRRD